MSITKKNHRGFEDILKSSSNIQSLEQRYKTIDKTNQEILVDFLLDVREEIIDGIQAGNFYDYSDAVIIADHFGVQQCDWTQYGCSDDLDIDDYKD